MAGFGLQGANALGRLFQTTGIDRAVLRALTASQLSPSFCNCLQTNRMFDRMEIIIGAIENAIRFCIRPSAL